MSKKQKILLIHGGTTYKNHAEYLSALKKDTLNLEWIKLKRDWKYELQNQLGNDFIIYAPQMPNKQNAQYSEWKIYFEKIMNSLDKNREVFLIGYSLGAIFLVKFLSENKANLKIPKIFLLGTPFDNSGMGRELLYSFIRKGSLSNLAKQVGKIFFYHSKDDFIVPFEHLSKYKKHLPLANYREYTNRGHFKQEKIPDLIRDIKVKLKK